MLVCALKLETRVTADCIDEVCLILCLSTKEKDHTVIRSEAL